MQGEGTIHMAGSLHRNEGHTVVHMAGSLHMITREKQSKLVVL